MLRTLFSHIVVVAAISVAGTGQSAKAQGVHVGAGPVHVDVGYPHYPHFRPAPYGDSGFGGYGAYRAYYRPAGGGHRDWHDTTHLDYRPRGFEVHYDHYDYVPRHYNVHHSGHWDAHD